MRQKFYDIANGKTIAAQASRRRWHDADSLVPCW
jgi:hypothetical protein